MADSEQTQVIMRADDPLRADVPLPELADLINEAHERVEGAIRSGLEFARQAGELLQQAKAQVPHGRWTAWIENNCQISLRTAQGYMRLARRWDELVGTNPQRVALLSLREALRLLT